MLDRRPGSPKSRIFICAALFLSVLLLTGAVFLRGDAAEFFLLSAAVCILCLSWIYPGLAAKGITVERHCERLLRHDAGGIKTASSSASGKPEPAAGSGFQEIWVVRLTVKSRLPLLFMWVSVKEELAHLTLQTETAQYRYLYIPWLKRSHSFTYSAAHLRRGQWSFRPTQADVGDMFGLRVRSGLIVGRQNEERIDIKPVALPNVNRLLPGGQLPEQNPRGMSKTYLAVQSAPDRAAGNKAAGTGPESRRYVPGDALHRINWQAMARGLGMHTFVEQSQRLSQTLLVVDDRLDGNIPDAAWIFDAVVGEAAERTRLLAREGKDVRLLASSGTFEQQVRANCAADLHKLERELTVLQPSGPARPGIPVSGNAGVADQWLHNRIQKLPAGAHLLIVTGRADAWMPPRRLQPQSFANPQAKLQYKQSPFGMLELAVSRGVRVSCILIADTQAGADGNGIVHQPAQHLPSAVPKVVLLPLTEGYKRPAVMKGDIPIYGTDYCQDRKSGGTERTQPSTELRA